MTTDKFINLFNDTRIFYAFLYPRITPVEKETHIYLIYKRLAFFSILFIFCFFLPFFSACSNKSGEQILQRTFVEENQEFVDTTFSTENYISENDTEITPELISRTYKNTIQTVQCFVKGNQLSYPMISLNGRESLLLAFDELGEESKNISYTFTHCTSDWRSSGASTFDITDGFLPAILSEYDYSRGTKNLYTHYTLQFPSQDLNFKLSGNYVITVFENNNPEAILLTQRFCIYEDLVTVVPFVAMPAKNDDKYYKQAITFKLAVEKIEIANPYTEIDIAIIQNGRWDDAKTGFQPTFIRDNILTYELGEDGVFNGISEFRYFDTRILATNERTEKINVNDTAIQVYLYPDKKKQFLKYKPDTDINGFYYIDNATNHNATIETDYTHVHFSLQVDEPYSEGVIYVFGELTQWKLDSNFRMEYNYTKKEYETTALLKQGYYNYEYVLAGDKQTTPDEVFIEGNHVETGNTYRILVYLTDPMNQYTRLVGYSVFNSKKF